MSRGSRGARILTLAALSLPAGCGSGDPPAGLPQITSASEEGFHDLAFRLAEQARDPDRGVRLRALGLHEGARVGFELRLAAVWKKAAPDAQVPITTYRGEVELRSIGPESDALLRAIDRVYGTRLDPKGMKPTTRFAAVALQGDPGDLSRGPVRIKLFFESDSPDAYAERFARVDAAGKVVQLREKDQDYRAAVVRALRDR